MPKRNLWIILSITLLGFVGCDNTAQLLTFRGNPLTWDSAVMPISILYTEALDCNSRDILQTVVKNMNVVFGKVFVAPVAWPTLEPSIAPGGTAMFRVTDELDNERALAVTELTIANDEKTIHSADVWIKLGFAEFSESLQMYIMKHELGHVLGLAHDANWDSIMYPSITGRTPFEKRVWEQADIDVIRELYFKQN